MLHLSFLRPLALPRPATLRAFFSTTTRTTASNQTQASNENPTSDSIPLTIIAQPDTTFTPLSSELSNLPYHVGRTGSKQLPIYLLRKRGGNLHQTRVRRITGNIEKLRADLQAHLKIEESKDCMVNSLTKQVIVKGHRKSEIMKFLVARSF